MAVELLVALARALTGDGGAGSGDELDDLARRAFAYRGVPAERRAASLRDLVAADPGFDVDASSPDGLLLDRVLTARRGHPLLLSVVVAEAGRRAGLPTGVFSSGARWYAGVRDQERLYLIDPAGPAPHAPPGRLRAHCGHTVAFAALRALEQRYLSAGELALACRAHHLCEGLPVEPGVADR